MSFLLICVMLLLVQISTSQADIVAIAAQGKCVCMDLNNPSTADTVLTDSRLRTRSSTGTNYKSWLQFDLNAIYAANPGLKGNIVIATLTFTGTGDNTASKQYMVNGLNDAAGMENWNPASLTWNNAPGNHIADSNLDPSVTTANLYTSVIQPGDGVTDSQTSEALVSFLNTDSDDLVTFIMTPGWTTYFYNAGSIHPPTLTLSMAAYCNTYFVAADGNDTTGNGSIGSPWKTIGKAVSMVVAGDTIYLRGGQHNYSDTITISKSGTSANPITLQNYQDETVILDFSEEAYESKKRGISLSGNYWHFKGFTVQYTDDTGIRVTGSHNTLERLVTHNNGDTGLHLGVGAAYNLVLNCDSSFNYDPEEYGEDADGFGAKGPTGSLPGAGVGLGNVFRGCRSWGNSDDGFDLWYAGNAVRIEDCWAFRNGVNIWGDPRFTGNGQGFKLGQGSGAHFLIHCLAYYNQHNGFDRNGNATGTFLYNNTGVRNLEYNFRFDDNTYTHMLRNNISYLGTVTMGSKANNTYNSWNTGFSVSASDFVSLDANGLDGPRGPNGELPKLKYMRLSVSSPLIDAGIDVGEPFNGGAPDLGEFEHIDGDCYTDGTIDWLDLDCLADNWLSSSCGVCNQADFSGDNKVNFSDFAIMAENWMQ